MGLDPQKQRLAEWMATPEAARECTQAALAAEFGVTDRTVRRWSSEKEVVDETTRLIQATAGAPEKLQAIYKALFNAATVPNGRGGIDVKAAQVYLAATGLALAASTIVVKQSAAEDLTTEEIELLLATRAEEMAIAKAQDTLV